MTRATATRLLVERLTHEVLVSNLGQATLDLQRLGDRPLNCYTFGAMGQCSSIGLGIALARPDVRVICLDGDGSLLMNLGSLCTIATIMPPNYALVVWDNEVHMTTGGQPTATAFRSSLAAIARGAGIEKVLEPADGTPPARQGCHRYWAWAQLMQRAFGIDVLACPRCAGRLRLVATVEDPQAVRAILESLGVAAEAPRPAPPRPP